MQRWLCPALDAGFFIFGPVSREGRHNPGWKEAQKSSWKARPHAFFKRRPGKSHQTSPRDPGAFRWTRKKTFFDNRKAGKSTPITLILITVGRGARVWIITSSARVEQYCG